MCNLYMNLCYIMRYNGVASTFVLQKAFVSITQQWSAPMALAADLELWLRRYESDCRLDLRFSDASSATDTVLAANLPVALDLKALLSCTGDPRRYGEHLFTMLFADPRAREAWVEARGYSRGAGVPLRVRLRIPAEDAPLHGLHWETLRDPVSNQLLGMHEALLLSRYLESATMARVTIPSCPSLRGLAAVAAPIDLERFGLAPINALAELARTRRAFGADVLRSLARAEGGEPLTLTALIAQLRDGAHVLYLVCHGRLVNGQPYLCLEGADGRVDWVAGEQLVERIAGLDDARRPLLVVLAACRGAGASDSATLQALGPRLAHAGIPAVVAMSGDTPITLVEQFVPALFGELRRHGQIDRAVAIARATIAEGLPWWMPVLFMRVRDGQLWSPPEEQPVSESLSDIPYVDRSTERALFAQMLRGESPTRGLILHSRGEGGWGKSVLIQLFLREGRQLPGAAPQALFFDPAQADADWRSIMDATVAALGPVLFPNYLALRETVGSLSPVAPPLSMLAAVPTALQGWTPAIDTAPSPGAAYGAGNGQQNLSEVFFAELQAAPLVAPLLWLVDGAEWLDRDTQAWLIRVFGRIAADKLTRLLLVVAGRQALYTQPSWRPQVELLDVCRFEKDAILDLLIHLGLCTPSARNDRLVARFSEKVLQKTQGKPIDILSYLQYVRDTGDF